MPKSKVLKAKRDALLYKNYPGGVGDGEVGENKDDLKLPEIKWLYGLKLLKTILSKNTHDKNYYKNYIYTN